MSKAQREIIRRRGPENHESEAKVRDLIDDAWSEQEALERGLRHCILNFQRPSQLLKKLLRTHHLRGLFSWCLAASCLNCLGAFENVRKS